MLNKPIEIKETSPGGIAEEMGICAGDKLISINNTPVKDVFDYKYLISDEQIEVLIEKADGSQWLLEIDKEADEDLGLVFESGLMDKARHCVNNCVFCFISQLPKNMRQTLYFKDDDIRLSFLNGNYVTLTNITDEEMERLIFYRLSPINISVHTTDPALRVFMLNNSNAGNILKQINKFYEAGIELNFQIVLCKGINDGKHLDKTINDLLPFIPTAKSLSVVPAGLTRYRTANNLHPIESFGKEDSIKILAQIAEWQKEIKRRFGTSFVFAADEFYFAAQTPVPSYKHYEDFPQLENGVGMTALFYDEFKRALKKVKPDVLFKNRIVTVVTAETAFGFISGLAAELETRVNNNSTYKLQINTVKIRNNFFGESITVCGLLTGHDIIEQLKGKPLGDSLLIPANALKSGELVFLDDKTLSDVNRELNVGVKAVETNGTAFINSILFDTENESEAK